jgi:hypothetical protein
MDSIHKRVGSGKAAYDRTIDARTIGCIRVALAAVSRRRGNVACRCCNHDHAIMRFAIMATPAIVRDAR